jgi:hypothetical protein
VIIANTYNNSFTAEDILGETVKQPVTTNKTKPVVKISSKQIQEIVKKEMKAVIHEEMVNFFTKYFAKTLAEETQKKLIKQLVNEGKIKLTKK